MQGTTRSSESPAVLQLFCLLEREKGVWETRSTTVCGWCAADCGTQPVLSWRSAVAEPCSVVSSLSTARSMGPDESEGCISRVCSDAGMPRIGQGASNLMIGGEG